MDASISARALDAMLGDWRDETRATGGRVAAPVYRALADRIRLLVLDGRVPVGTRLPAERDLAERLHLSRTTVTAAYRELRDADLIRSVRGSGSVARLPGVPATLPAPPPGDVVDFSKAAPPALPWLTDVARDALDDLPRHLPDSGFDPIGTPELRTAIADRYTARGLPTDPGQIMVTIGAQHAIGLLARALVGRGDRALVEAPTYPHAVEAMQTAGARLATVPVLPGAEGDGHGDADEAEAFVRVIRHANPVLAYVMPDFQNPTGRSLGADARERMLDAAARQGTVVVADETTAELDIDRGVDLAPLAAYGPAVMVGSVGKTVWGGLRVGWIRADRGLIRRLLAVRSPGDLGTPILEQLIVARLLARMDDILALRREQLRAGRARLETLLAETFPEWRVPHVDGGIVTWINLGAPVSSQLALAARTEGLLIAAGPRFGIDGAFERFLRLPICYPAETTDAAVAALARAWRSLARVPAAEPGELAAVV